MRKILTTLTALAIFTLTIFSFSVPHSALAFNVNDPTNSGQGVCSQGSASSSTFCQDSSNPQNKISGSNGIIYIAANLIAAIGGAVAVIMLIIGGIKYTTSNGDSKNINDAKNLITYALVGIAIITLARVLVSFVLGKL